VAALEHTPFAVGLLPTATGALGILLAYVFYIARPDLPVRLATQFRGLYLFLLNKWYFDELYDAIFVRPALAAGRALWQVGDATLIDGVPNGLAELAQGGSRQVVRVQTGSIAVYAFTMLIGVVALLSLFLVMH
jgi:NADH-quinone oxidoreductase subunit L